MLAIARQDCRIFLNIDFRKVRRTAGVNIMTSLIRWGYYTGVNFFARILSFRVPK